MKKDKRLWTAVGGASVVASLCCLTPLVLVMTGLATASFAASLADTFYGTYKWAFRAVGLLALAGALVLYFRGQGVCTLDDVKRKRNMIINKTLIALIVGILCYVIFLYVIVHYVGVWYGIWVDY